MRACTLGWMLVVALLAAEQVSAQEPPGRQGRRWMGGGMRGGMGNGMRGGTRGGMGRGPGDFFKRLDANGDGMLQPQEIPDRMRPFLEQRIKDAGLDPSQPVSIAQLEKPQSQQGGPGQQPPGGGNPEQPADPNAPKPEGAADGTKPGEAAPQAQPPAAPAVPGFGVPPTAPKVPGFGTAPQAAGPGAVQGAAAVPGAAAVAPPGGANIVNVAAANPAAPAPANAEQNGRRAFFAQNLLKQYDGNKNGYLEKEEWSLMRGNPERGDQDGNGLLTEAELVQWLESRTRERHGGPPPGQGGPGPGQVQAHANPPPQNGAPVDPNGGKRSYRFRSPHERLPEGLPEWFSGRDANRDGQVSMAEYSGSWNDATVAEFARYDRNRDGIVTPRECLTASRTP